MRVLDIFSGIGGMSLGLERAGMETVAFCEIDPFCRRVLAKHWPDMPIHEDVRELDADAVGPVDLIAGGVPCQPASRAGKQQGKNDDRWLWPEALRLVEACRPRWVLFENPPGIYDVGLDGILVELEGLGYSNYIGERGDRLIAPIEIPACSVDAPHIRNRVWIVGHSRHAEPSGRQDTAEGQLCEPRHESAPPSNMAHTAELRCHRSESERRGEGEATGERRLRQSAGDCSHGELEHAPRLGRREGRPEPELRGWWTATAEPSGLGDADDPASERFQQHSGQILSIPEASYDPSTNFWADHEWIIGGDGKRRRVEPGIRLLASGVPERVAKLRALGNAVIPQVVEAIGHAIMEAECKNSSGSQSP